MATLPKKYRVQILMYDGDTVIGEYHQKALAYDDLLDAQKAVTDALHQLGKQNLAKKLSES